MTLADFAEAARAACAPLLVDGWPVDWAMDQKGLVSRSGIWCEFGVAEGKTLDLVARCRGDAELWGFDSFRGLPEDWKFPKGTFAQKQPPMPPEGVRVVVGLFEETLPCWAPHKPITFVHLDCDLYTGASQVLAHVAPHLAPGAVLVLDDLFTAPYHQGVMRALYEAHTNGLRWTWLAKCADTDTAAIQVKL